MKKLLLFIFSVTFYLYSFSFSKDTITPAIHHIEMPLIKKGDDIIKHTGFTLCYNEQHEQASWVAYELTDIKANGQEARTNKFVIDPLVSTGTADNRDYGGSGYDRGHLAPAADMAWSETTMQESFYFSNMSPQTPSFNRGIWKKLEEQVREWAIENKIIYVTTGPVLSDHLPQIGPNKVSVPQFYYKVLLDFDKPEQKAIGFILPNEASSGELSTFAVSIDSVEAITGINFFHHLPDDIEQLLESRFDAKKWFSENKNFDQHHPKPIKSSNEKKDSETHNHNHAIQCVAVTKKGTRCKNMTKDNNNRCGIHR